MEFIWDDEKAAVNERKHDIDFDMASLVFLAPNRIEEYDGSHSVGEDRWLTLGLVRATVLFVVYAERRDDVIRIISARKANRHEQKSCHKAQARS